MGGMKEAACQSNGFGLCITHPACDHVRASLAEAQAKIDALLAAVQPFASVRLYDDWEDDEPIPFSPKRYWSTSPTVSVYRRLHALVKEMTHERHESQSGTASP